ncbi:MAG: tRNA (adenosine(37)-N6)-threonylcarbamoyltransferase complex transferase subunit TsaD [Rickettsiaceae bacterium]|nr:tRNA (adenosine(37)-N6)-threonylcarbamoyltransferase complex transferase subunit TsaD [Rickettsiaceae bacterium]
MKNKPTYILGIESSCDDTGVAIVTSERKILTNIVLSSIEDNSPYKGVVPEIAARSHLSYIRNALDSALQESKLDFNQIDAIAATAGPGLIGGVIVGTVLAKALAFALKKPYIAINHLEGHAVTVRLTDNIPYPYLLLLASGGHCQFVAVLGLGRYKILGQTLDDAAGEAFDKTAKLLNLGFPGGPIIEKLAELGKNYYPLPMPLCDKSGCDMSFSGLKTATRNLILQQSNNSQERVQDICLSFQYIVAEILKNRSINAINSFKQLLEANNIKTTNPYFVFAGGVAANKTLRETLKNSAEQIGMQFCAPPINLCTDNAAMIAWAGLERYEAKLFSPLDFAPRPRWPLSELKDTL